MERIRASVPLCRKDARRPRPRSLARPLSGPRRRLGFPLTRVWRLRQPRVEGWGRRSGVGLGRERRKEGETATPQGQRPRRGPPVVRAIVTPTQGMGQGRALEVPCEGHPSINWVWTPPVPPPFPSHTRCLVSWPDQSSLQGKSLAVKVKSAPRFSQESSE